jgi:hypothetical protein
MMAKGFSKHRLKILRVASGPEKCRLNVAASCRRKTLCKTSLISEIHKPEQKVKKKSNATVATMLQFSAVTYYCRLSYSTSKSNLPLRSDIG